MTFVTPRRDFSPQSSAQMARGANPDADPATWVWTDITAYLRGTAVISKGQPSRSPTADPARLSITLNNTDGRFSPDNAMSPYWPDIVENMPVRLLLTGIGDPLVAPYERITAFVDAWPIVPQAGVADVIIPLTASGQLRRRTKGNKPVRSILRTLIPQTAPVAYWALEDASNSTQSLSNIPGGYPLQLTSGAVKFGQSDPPPGSNPVADFSSGGTLSGRVGAGSSSTTWRLEFSAKWNTIAVGDFTVAMQWSVDGTVDIWEIDATDVGSGGLYIQYLSTAGTFDLAASNIAVDDGLWHRIRVDAAQSGGNIAITVTLDGNTVISHTFAGLTNGRILTVTPNPTGDASTEVPAMGHIAVWAPYASPITADTMAAATGYARETVGDRMARLAAEGGFEQVFVASSTPMGPQPVGARIDLLQQCADTDGGLFHDGGPGGALAFVPLASLYNASAALTLDYNASQIDDGLGGTRDDALLYNDTIATDAAGNTAESADTASITLVGEQDQQPRVNVFSPTQLGGVAGWQTHVGAFRATRYPTVTIDLRRNPELIASVLAGLIPARLLLKHLPPKIYGYNDVDLLARGYTETIDGVTWKITFNCVPGGPYQVGQLDSATNGHIDPASCVLAGGGWNGTAGSFTTTTTGGPLLSTSGADYPVDLNLNGQRVTVSGAAGASNPQTVTVSVASVNGVSKTHPAGEAVALWQPFFLAL